MAEFSSWRMIDPQDLNQTGGSDEVDYPRIRQGRPRGLPLAPPADKVMTEAKRLDAIPYDVKDVELGHHGKECSFEAILKKYMLTGDAALVLLGRIVNGADTDNKIGRASCREGG